MNAPSPPAELAGAFQDIDLKEISLSQTLMQVHRRATLNMEAMKLLTENVRAVGILQPVLVRPIAKGFELVAGERRFLAAKGAGRNSIPAMVRVLTDLQTIELQVIENKQREDLHELIEAEGYEELMKKHKYTAEQIADKVGMSRRYVFNRLKLLELCPELRTEFLGGKINASIAQLLARIPVPDLQRQAFREITQTRFHGEPMSVRQAAEHLQRNYMLRLDNATFKTGDETLLPKVGACGPCPKRTGNQKDLFPDVKSADICTDPSCFAAKKAAHMERLRKEAEGRGHTVIAGAEAKKIKPNDYGDLRGGFVDVDKETYMGGKFTSVRKLLGKSMPDTTLLQDPHADDKFIEIVQQNLVAKTLTAKGISLQSRSTGNSADAEHRKNERIARMKTALRTELFAAIRQKPIKLGHDELIMIAVANWESLQWECREKLCPLWGWKEHGDHSAAIEKLDDRQLARLLLDMVLITEVKVNTYHARSSKATNLLAVAKKVGADAAGITKKHQAVFDAKEKERADKKRKMAANARKKLEAATAKPADKPEKKAAPKKAKK